MHPDQLTVPVATVRALVDAQFPAWRDLPVTRVAAQGTVNAIFRLGERLAARFPLVPRDVAEARAWLAAEAEAARELAGRTRFRTPEPVALGEPGLGYPLPWSVQTWLTGTVATDADHRSRSGSPTTWPSSSGASARSTPGGGCSPAPAAAATCATTTPGWRPASSAARACWTCRGCAGCGRGCARSNPPMSRMGRRTLDRVLAG